MSKWIILLALLMATTAQAAPPNTYRTPTCFSDVSKLPIYNLTAKLRKTSELEINSSVVLIGDNLWRTTAHSVGYNMDAYVMIIAPHKTIIAKIWLLDIGRDVAYLNADSTGLTPIPAASTDLKQNETVWNVGYPGLFDMRLLSTEGMFARFKKDGRIVVSSIAWGGMSGGASLRCNGDTLEMFGTITHTKRLILTDKVWTDNNGVLHREVTYMNSGYAIIAPIKQ